MHKPHSFNVEPIVKSKHAPNQKCKQINCALYHIWTRIFHYVRSLESTSVRRMNHFAAIHFCGENVCATLASETVIYYCFVLFRTHDSSKHIKIL